MFDLENLFIQFQNMKQEQNSIERIIGKFLVPNLSEKKSIELCHLGKFINKLDRSLEIVEQIESPDFIIKSQCGKSIGIELQTISNELKERESIKEDIIDFSEKIFRVKFPEIKILVNFYFNISVLKISKNQKFKISEEINEFVYNCYKGEIHKKKPDFIKEIKILPHTNLLFNYNPGGFIVRFLSDPDLMNAIIKKKN
ncbi:hypothetical protein CHRYSEOSP005_19460 [Chryseobacterium sp. Alg-005]|uniref:hypothetical protein n=1 Tax=Chryseobacterium sp. Alg-005 TaxID=3159516 RepID=UPI0035557AAD